MKERYKCGSCGYVYDPDLGDLSYGIESGTEFEELPKEWVCPVCSASKDDFEIVEEK